VHRYVPLDGVMPMRQARSEATFHALVQAGRKALESGSFESLKIADLALAANTSVGAFYGRFENRHAFLEVVQQVAVADMEGHFRVLFDTLDRQHADLRRFMHSIAQICVACYRDNRGLYRAVYKHSLAQPAIWQPFRQLGWTTASLIVDRLLPRLIDQGLSCDEAQIRVAAQFINGLLVNATINDPGPIHLEDPQMEAYIAHFLCSFLGVTAASPARLKGKAR
jgi:AcrR family transcriptional regulator